MHDGRKGRRMGGPLCSVFSLSPVACAPSSPRQCLIVRSVVHTARRCRCCPGAAPSATPTLATCNTSYRGLHSALPCGYTVDSQSQNEPGAHMRACVRVLVCVRVVWRLRWRCGVGAVYTCGAACGGCGAWRVRRA